MSAAATADPTDAREGRMGERGPRWVRRGGVVALVGLLWTAAPATAQTGGGPAEEAVSPPPLPPASPLARVVDRPEDRQVEIVVGPVDFTADLGHLRLPIQMVDLPLSGWLHGFRWAITTAEGDTLPDALLHHVNLIEPDARELFAPIARRVMAAGRETSREEMPRLIGYPVEEGTRLLVAAMFANPTGRDLGEAYLRVRLDYTTDEDGWIDPRDVYPFYLDVMGPVGPKDFPVPPGRTVRAWEGSPAVGGRILGIGGHLHDYAEELLLIDVTAGDTIWRAEPIEEDGKVVGVPSSKLWWRGGVRLHPEHTYRIEVVYENPTDRPTPNGGMGAIGGVLLAPEAEWPPLDREDPAYATDLRDTLETPFRGSGHGGHGHGGQGHGGGEDASGEAREAPPSHGGEGEPAGQDGERAEEDGER